MILLRNLHFQFCMSFTWTFLFWSWQSFQGKGMMGNEGHISPMAGMQVAFDALVCLCLRLRLRIHLCLCLHLRVHLCVYLCLRLRIHLCLCLHPRIHLCLCLCPHPRIHLCLCLRLMTVSWHRGWWGWTTCSTTAWAMAWTGWTMGCRWPPSTWPRLEFVNREIIWKIKIREKDKHDDNSPIPDERDGEPKHDESRDEGDDEHEQRNAGINLSFLSFLN